ncbi:MAG: phosphatidate cytidylyltransferase, partial [Alphaproteobacteria bacterium]|nr:phosphatidate cytidylyltransferase [Alphaproteobacteria bacterium]
MARSSAGRSPRELTSRIVSGLVLGPSVLAVIWLGGPLYFLLMLAVALLGAREWVRLVFAPAIPEEGDPSLELSWGFLAAALIVAVAVGPRAGLVVLAALTGLLFLMLRALGQARRRMIALGIPYMGLAVLSMVWLRGLDDEGRALTFWLVLVVWTTDIAAYAAGRAIGGPRLAPTVSPNKTWAGLLGAMVGAVLAGVAFAVAFGVEVIWPAAVMGAVLAVVAQSGDLAESAMKRRHGMKDSGSLIPGHGGILDRIDGVIAAAP